MLCIDFVLFLKGQILKEFQNIEKFVIFRTKHYFEMHSYVSNTTHQKRPDWMKNHVSFSIQRKQSVPDIRSYPISECTIYTASALQWDQTKPHRVSFSLSFARVFLFFCLCLSFYFLSCETQRKHNLKCKQICKLLSCFYFLCSSWHK